jgi:hypothetical protein
MRMWSMSKPVAAVALLTLAHETGVTLSPDVQDAMRRAIERSENCAQRRVVLELQELADGPGQAAVAFGAILRDAGSQAAVATATQPADPVCYGYLTRTAAGLRSPRGPGLLLGTSTWSIRDAVAFTHALATGRYGEAGAEVLRLMRGRKLPSAETRSGDYTASLDWGAGRALRAWDPAYKAGWGGTLHNNFLAGQLAVVQINGVRVAMAAMFHPNVQPDRDDPGRTAAPAAIEAIFGTVVQDLIDASVDQSATDQPAGPPLSSTPG